MTGIIPRGGMVVETIDMTPTWRGLIPLFVAAIESGTHSARSAAVEELLRLADFADRVNDQGKAP